MGQSVNEINWREHILKEPRERVRSLTDDREGRLFAALAEQYPSDRAFYLRMDVCDAEACALTWNKVDWLRGTIEVRAKGDKILTLPLPDDVMDLLASIRRDGSRIFRYANGDPITVPGGVFWRAKTAAGIENLKFAGRKKSPFV